jgi:cobalt ECF transporter T component CbiQ
MSFHHLDQYATISSPVTRAVPAVRVLGTATLACGAALLPLGAWVPLLVLFAVVVLVGGLARLPLTAVLARMSGPAVFVLLASAGLLFLVPGEPVARLGPVAVSDAGFERFTFVLGRAVVALGAAVILVSTTTFPQLLQAFRQLRMPNVVTTALALAYRLVYLLVDEMERLQRAAKSRNAGAGRATRRRLLVSVTAAGLSRAFARGERTHRAMLARGYRGEAESLDATRWELRQSLMLGTMVLFVASIVVLAHARP